MKIGNIVFNENVVAGKKVEDFVAQNKGSYPETLDLKDVHAKCTKAVADAKAPAPAVPVDAAAAAAPTDTTKKADKTK